MMPNTIKGKLLLVLVIALAGMGVVSVSALYSERNTILEDRKTKTRHLVEVAQGLLGYYEQQEKSGALSGDDARKAAIAAIKGLRYEGKEYFWINDLGTPVPKMIMHPTVPALDGKVLDAAKFNCATSLQDGIAGPVVETDGKMNLFVAFNTVANRAERGYVTYLWPKPKQGGGTTEETYLKLSYVVKFAPWNWVIGSGIYIDDVDEIFRARVIAAVGDITQALREQSVATQLVAGSVEKIVAMAEQNSSETGEIAGTAERLESLARQLHETVERFRV